MSQTYQGVVVNRTDSPLKSVSVLLLDNGGKPFAFTKTNTNGRFSVNSGTKKQAVKILFSCIGYSKDTIDVTKFVQGQKIILEEENTVIRNVEVRAGVVGEEGDTLNYLVSKFQQGQDRKLADVIAKMPGLDVRKDGVIEFHGNPINKFYIEGLDLLGSRYSQASENINIDKIKKVQVIRNHQPVRMLRGVKFSDQAALNIVLKDDAAAVWSGSAEIGLGYGDDALYDCRLTGMRFNKRFQTLMMYKNNDTGKEIGNEVADIAAFMRGRTSAEQGILSMMSVGTPQLASERYTFNHSHLIAGNWLWKIGNDSELRVQGNGYIDKETMNSHRQTTYLTLADLPVVIEEQDVDNSRSEWKTEVNYQYNGDKTYIKNNLRGYADFNKSIGAISYNGNRTDLSVKPHKRYLIEDFQLSHTTAKGNVYGVNSYITYNYLPGQLLTINNRTEKLNLNFLGMDNSLEYRLRIGKQYFNNNIGMSYDSQDIGLAMDDDTEQSYRYQLSKIYWKPSFAFRFSKHRLNLETQFAYAHQSYRQNSSNHLWIDESIYWNWKASAVSEFSANVSYNNSPLMGKAIYDTPLFTDYRTQQTNRGETDVRHSFTAMAAYQYSNPMKGFFFNIRPLYIRTSGNILYTTNIDNDIYSVTATDKDYTTETKEVQGRVSKSFLWAKLNLSANTSHSITDYSLLVGNCINDARMTTTRANISYSLNPLRQLAFEGASGIMVSRQQNLTQHDMSSGSTTWWQHFLNIHIFPTDKWTISLKNDLFHSDEHGFGINYFCDFVLGYKTKCWELSFTTNNLIGTSRFEQRMLGNMVETYSVTHLRPREFIVKWGVDI